MATDIVQFREDTTILAYLRARGVNPNELAREVFEATVRRYRSEENMKKLEAMKVESPGDAATLVRESREERAAALDRILRRSRK